MHELSTGILQRKGNWFLNGSQALLYLWLLWRQRLLQWNSSTSKSPQDE